MATAGCFSDCRFIDMIKMTEVTTMETKKIILKLRTERGMSQDELANKVMVTRQAVSRWENGDTVLSFAFFCVSQGFRTNVCEIFHYPLY